ncbi:hypothetical protein [Shewanella gaetbuli]|uniref:Uncharacterized protein n=1 Tax=Shewanella gaetbuli TaxID=220752 RepID=A0A9X2CJZ7_9GAMM|nr:hypothetical protein [Shewanella gaetbuli]MCL1142576.1 hypothetical protein [Shewanella gaetbuli]
MNNDIALEKVIHAFEELEFEQRTTTNLENARSKQQMTTYLKSLDYSLRRLQVLQECVNELVDEKNQQLLKQEKVQTLKTKMINVSRQYGISYQEVLKIMLNIQQRKSK